jgi:hypothetical protein
MKRIISITAALLITLCSWAQSPEKLSYQSVIRNAGNDLVVSTGVGMQISILQGSVSGAAVYVETQTPSTNINGLVSIEIGTGTVVSGAFNLIDWSTGPYFIKTETDPAGGTTYTITGTSQLMSVPYALYAKTSGNGAGPAGADGNDGADGANGIDGAVGATGPQGPQGNIGSSGADGADGADGIGIAQTLLIEGDYLFISDGNYIHIPGLSLINSLIAEGCTDPTALNYNASANTDDGSCIAVVNGCIDPTALNYNAAANTDAGSCIAVVNGCTDATATNYNAAANTDDGSCIAVVNGCMDPTAVNYDASANTDDGSCIAVVNGCTDSTAFNYDASANTDDGSCIAVVNGCTDPLYTEYDASANTDDGSCTTLVVNGCTDSTAFNYDALANTDDGSCIAVVNGCMDPTAFNYDAAANTDDGSCIAVVNGCTDATATNYNASANTDDGSCIFLPANDNCATAEAIVCGGSSTGSTSNATASGFGGSNNAGSDIWYSFTGTGDGITVSLLGSSFDTYLRVYDACGGTEVASNDDAIPGSDLTSTVTFTSVLGTDYKISCGGYQALTGDVVISVTCIVLGCTDPTAPNYDALANTDDGSCIAVVNGCTDPTAFNYNGAANTDDGSCTYLAIGDTYQGGIIFYLDGNGGGLIAAPTDQATVAEWGCYSWVPSTELAIGTGAQNTIIIEAGCTTPGTAADICANYDDGTYDDWFLPSRDELNYMWLNIGQGNALGLGNIGSFYSVDYWSSSDYCTGSGCQYDYYLAWYQDFSNGYQGPTNKNFTTNSVRAVRAF